MIAPAKSPRMQLPLPTGTRVALVVGSVIPTAMGAAMVCALSFWALPTGAALSDRNTLMLNAVTGDLCVVLAVPLGLTAVFRWSTGTAAG